MKKKTISVNSFEAKDFEEAFAKYLEREGMEPRQVSISDMKFTLIDYIPMDKGTCEGMGFYIDVDDLDLTVSEYDLFRDPEEESDQYFLPNGECIGDDIWDNNIQDPSVLFDFDISQFKSFDRFVDSSD